jgi:hypothetical protein
VSTNPWWQHWRPWQHHPSQGQPQQQQVLELQQALGRRTQAVLLQVVLLVMAMVV